MNFNKKLIIEKSANLNYAEKLLGVYGLEVCHAKTPSGFCLVLTPNGLCLRNFSQKMPDMLIDYANKQILHRLDKKRVVHESLIKACKLKNQNINFLVDATFGTGIDSLILSNIADKIVGYESNFYTFLLTKDAIYRAKKANILSNELEKIQLIFGESSIAMAKLKNLPEVIYLDPMFNEDKKSQAKKNMQFMRHIAMEQNTHEILHIAQSQAKNKVVIKRPIKADRDKKITYSLAGKNTRFDIYQNN